jgi:hypothetical protein
VQGGLVALLPQRVGGAGDLVVHLQQLVARAQLGRVVGLVRDPQYPEREREQCRDQPDRDELPRQ